MRRAIYLFVACLALISTAAIMGVFVILALRTPRESSGQILSRVSVALEAIILAVLTWFISACLSDLIRQWLIKNLRIYNAIYVLAILSATVTTVASLTQFSKSTFANDEKLLGTSTEDLLVGLCVALGTGFALQTGFLLVHFSLLTLIGDHHSPPFHGKSFIKSLRYSQIAPGEAPISAVNSPGSRNPCPSIGGRPRSGTVTSKDQLADAMYSVMSKKQVTTNEAQQPYSAEPILHRSSGDAFGTWDASSVDTPNHQARLEAITPPRTKGQFLETIAEGPTGIETLSPNNDETPFGSARIQAPSRSYSPMLSRRKQLLPQSSMDEPDIHPLWRSNC
ncbi:hypothetical protein CEP54_012708 [Fusarium duplospermum]|uniref:Uncharacterized protein n=1 Tax=Fusarium duplospermum TaxID=1325734 RepID=A0A428P739_9HYPO|nr:hypothetical protein CEP54_012708 [Fusarium duplospermum]